MRNRNITIKKLKIERRERNIHTIMGRNKEVKKREETCRRHVVWQSAFTPQPLKIIFRKKNRTGGFHCHEGFISHLLDRITNSFGYWIKNTLVWNCCYLCRFVITRKKEHRHRALALMTCQLCASRSKKSDIRVAIYYFDFMWGDGAEIDRVWLSPFNYTAFNSMALCTSTVR